MLQQVLRVPPKSAEKAEMVHAEWETLLLSGLLRAAWLSERKGQGLRN